MSAGGGPGGPDDDESTAGPESVDTHDAETRKPAKGLRPRLTRKVRLKFDPIEKQFLLLYPERGMKLSDSAAEILQRCDGQRTLEGIALELAQVTGAPLETLRRDVIDFVAQMRSRGLVEFV